jgi:putative ABC transport system substrate-binding protein
MKRLAVAFAVIPALALAVLPVAAWSKPAGKAYRIGVLGMVSLEASVPFQRGIEQGFREAGYVVGQNVRLEYRFAAGDAERLRQFAAELVRLPVDLIITGTNPATTAAKQATRQIPIIMTVSADPVRAGFIESLAKPGGNITGLTADASPETIGGKGLELLREVLPHAARIAVLWNPAVPTYEEYMRRLEAPAKQLRLAVQSVAVQEPSALEEAFSAKHSAWHSRPVSRRSSHYQSRRRLIGGWPR